MKLRMPTSRRALMVLGVVVTVAAAAVVWQNLPTPTDVLGPFEVRGDSGTPVTGRGVEATVTSVRISPEVNSRKPALPYKSSAAMQNSMLNLASSPVFGW